MNLTYYVIRNLHCSNVVNFVNSDFDYTTDITEAKKFTTQEQARQFVAVSNEDIVMLAVHYDLIELNTSKG